MKIKNENGLSPYNAVNSDDEKVLYDQLEQMSGLI